MKPGFYCIQSPIFRPTTQPSFGFFRRFGIRCLRIGGNTGDNVVPTEPQIDSLFAFAQKAGVKVIYTLCLKSADAANNARIAAYINAHYRNQLLSFAIGNEPEEFPTMKHQCDQYQALWKSHLDAVLQAVPDAPIEGRLRLRMNTS